MTRPRRVFRGVEFDPWRYRFGVLTAAATLVLIFIGGLVTSTGSGLSVPDWPLSYGMLMPPMVGGVFYEHGHRMAATIVGFLTLVLAVWTARAEARPEVRWLAWAALVAVVAQGILGGLTVLYLLPTAVSVAHACLAQTFFCLLVTIAYVTSREWTVERAPGRDEFGLRNAALLAAASVYVQLLLGAVMRHLGAGLAIPDFPLAFGGILPAFASVEIFVNFAHRVGAVVVLVCVSRLYLLSRRSADARFLRPAGAALGLVLFQMALGGTAVLTQKAITPTTLHVATGAGILGLCFFLALRTWRHLVRSPRPMREASPLPVAQA